MEEMVVFDLVTLTRGGDNLAFSELVKQYTPLMNKEISDLNCPHLSVGEMYAEACIGLHRAAMTFNPEKSVTFGLYAKICIRHRLVDLLRTNKVLKSDVDVEKLFVTPSIDSRLASAERFESLMSKSKSLLSDLEYKIFVLDIQGYRTARISEILSIERKAVDNGKNRIHRKLRKHLGEAKDEE